MLKVNNADAVRWLMEDKYSVWSYNGACAIASHFEREGIPFSPHMVRNNYAEYAGCTGAAIAHGWKPPADTAPAEAEEQACEWLAKSSTVLKFDGGVVVQYSCGRAPAH